MTQWARRLRTAAAASCAVIVLSSCSFQGLNSLPLPGAVGRGDGAQHFHIEFTNVGALEPNSPVMVNDVIVGSIQSITLRGWHAVVDASVRPGTVVPRNAVASIGQTSLLGSMHVSLDPPIGEPSQGRLPSGSTISWKDSVTAPSTEQTLSAVSVLVNAGGLGQLGDIIHNFNVAVGGRESDIRSLIERLNRFVGTLNDQRASIVDTLVELDRFAGTLADRQQVLERALKRIPAALDVLVTERPHLTEALTKLGEFGTVATRLVNNSKDDLVTNLNNLRPAFCALADLGPDVDTALAFATVFPFGQNFIDRAVRGDYINMFSTFDITVPRIKRGLAQGTPSYQGNAPIVPAPGDPGYDAFYAQFPDPKTATTPIPPWLAALPPDTTPPFHLNGVAPLGVQPPILKLPPATTPSGCA
ncbi:MCE family protein [Mycolicibacterium vinylchloridicum]|uniref:MCE family protein n=1 Tax=Mycolicibacterium vinylchloridicum TaxID=2736928 RepID=UPI0015C96EE5|nr:MCE family protein [Mycolicibacterium vinylchloridicum]